MKRLLCLGLILSTCLGCAGIDKQRRYPGAPLNIIEAAAGENIAIDLESNGTTGYRWEIAEFPDKNILKLEASDYRAERTGIIGAGGTEIWVFKALLPGETSVVFKYVRPWERGVAPARVEKFIIKVKNGT